MNKFGFISLILTFVLFFLQFIPLGFYFQFQNPYVNSYVRIPIQLISFQNNHLFFLGVMTNGVFQTWFEVNLLTGVLFIVLMSLAAIVVLVGFWKENKTGKKLILVNFIVLLTILLYLIIGIPMLSQEIFGTQIDYLDIFIYLNYGFYILLLNLIFAAISYWKHPIELKGGA
ncbi:MAG: hypothetical protein ACFE88_14235 [Candidatus Hermodarchaeota archaeon]